MRTLGVIVIGGLGRSLLGVRELVAPSVRGLPLVERGLGVLASMGIEERLILLPSGMLDQFIVPTGACAIAFDDGESPRHRLHGLLSLGEGDEIVFLLVSDGIAATPSRLRALLKAVGEGAELAYLPASFDGRSDGGAPSALAFKGATLKRALRSWGNGSPGALVDWAKASDLDVRVYDDGTEALSRTAQ